MYVASCFYLLFLLFLNREIYFDDSTRRTFVNTLCTHTALIEVNVADIVFDSDGVKLTNLLTFTAADTGNFTGFLGNSTLVFVYTLHINTMTFWSLLAKFDDVTWTSLDTSTTRCTLFFVYLRKTGFRIHVNGIKLTSLRTIPTTQTTESTTRF